MCLGELCFATECSITVILGVFGGGGKNRSSKARCVTQFHPWRIRWRLLLRRLLPQASRASRNCRFSSFNFSTTNFSSSAWRPSAAWLPSSTSTDVIRKRPFCLGASLPHSIRICFDPTWRCHQWSCKPLPHNPLILLFQASHLTALESWHLPATWLILLHCPLTTALLQFIISRHRRKLRWSGSAQGELITCSLWPKWIAPTGRHRRRPRHQRSRTMRWAHNLSKVHRSSTFILDHNERPTFGRVMHQGSPWHDKWTLLDLCKKCQISPYTNKKQYDMTFLGQEVPTKRHLLTFHWHFGRMPPRYCMRSRSSIDPKPKDTKQLLQLPSQLATKWMIWSLHKPRFFCFAVNHDCWKSRCDRLQLAPQPLIRAAMWQACLLRWCQFPI